MSVPKNKLNPILRFGFSISPANKSYIVPAIAAEKTSDHGTGNGAQSRCACIGNENIAIHFAKRKTGAPVGAPGCFAGRNKAKNDQSK